MEACALPPAWRQVVVAPAGQPKKFDGIGSFNFSTAWGGWREWPGLSICCDLGSDGVSAWHALSYFWEVNAWLFPDESHSCKHSFMQVVKNIGAWPLLLILLVSWNLEFGPRQEEARRSELRLALHRCYLERRPSQCPLFMVLAPRMVQELEENRLANFARTAPIEEELWEYLKDRNNFGSMGRRVCMARYGAPLDAAAKNRGLWTVQLWERTFVAIEHGHITKRQSQLQVKAAEATRAADGRATTTKGLLIEDTAIRGAAQNAVGISVMVLEQRHHQRLVDIICIVSKGLSDFHTDQNRVLRSIPDSCDRLAQMCSGAYMQHLASFVCLLSDQAALSPCSFVLPSGVGPQALKELSLDAPLEREADVENDYARIFGQAVLHMISARATRGLWMFGWPAQMAAIMSGGERAATTVQRFREDLAIHVELTSETNQPPVVKDILGRHLMKMTANRQLAAAVSELGHDAHKHPGLIGLVRARASCLQATQLIEDFNAAQAASALKPCRRFRKPATCMGTILEKKLISCRHRYSEVEALAAAPSQRSVLPRAAWAPGASGGSMPFNDIVSVSQSPSWWSTTPERMTTPVADMAMLRHMRQAGAAPACMSAAWLDAAVDVDHCLAIGWRDCPGGANVSWYVGLHYFPKSAVLLWPATLRQLGNFQYWELRGDTSELILKPILSWDPDVMLVARYEWRSWL